MKLPVIPNSLRKRSGNQTMEWIIWKRSRVSLLRQASAKAQALTLG